MLIFCRRIIINKPELLKKKGPLLLACNHPNSFLDAAILADLFKYPVYSLTRGDVFKNPFYSKILTALKMLPVYRTSEGTENLGINYETFEDCKRIFKKEGIVLIFSEAKCINEWHLRPLRKGTARLAFSSWEENIPLEVLPVGINYSSFRRFSKNLFINFGEIMTKNDFDLNEPDGKKNQAFNNKLEEGWLIHAPLYLPIKNFTYKKTWDNDHYDSVLIALLLFIYPLYVILITILILLLTHNLFSWLLIIALPFTARAYVQLKPQLDKQVVYKSA